MLPLCQITSLLPPFLVNSVRYRPISIRFQHTSLCVISNNLTTFCTENCDAQAFAGVFTEELDGLRRRLTDVIDGANGKAPLVSVQGGTVGFSPTCLT